MWTRPKCACVKLNDCAGWTYGTLAPHRGHVSNFGRFASIPELPVNHRNSLSHKTLAPSRYGWRDLDAPRGHVSNCQLRTLPLYLMQGGRAVARGLHACGCTELLCVQTSTEHGMNRECRPVARCRPELECYHHPSENAPAAACAPTVPLWAAAPITSLPFRMSSSKMKKCSGAPHRAKVP
jgi:hypothetical protein